MATSSAPSEAGAPSHALVPALATSMSGQPALDRLAPRDRFGHRAAAGVAGADEENAHDVRHHRRGPGRFRAAVAARSRRAE